MQTLSAAARTQAARLRLKKSRRLATALLLAAAALFCLSAAFLHHYPQLAYLKAFSEAAMIGGLADWFAVTALFRRPLGLPVPHTAILPRNQNRIADELGRFIEYNFLRERPVALRVYRAAPTEKLLRRLADPAVRRIWLPPLCARLPDLLQTVPPEQAARFAAKLGMPLEAATEAAIADCRDNLRAVPAARLFDEAQKLFMSGYGEACFEVLQRYGLFAMLFPDAGHVFDHPNAVYAQYAQRLVRIALANTDARVAEDKPVTIAFLLAAILWPVYQLQYRGLLKERDNWHSAMHEAVDVVHIAASERLAIPVRLRGMIREIWTLQARLEQAARGNLRKMHGVLAHPRFRAAYDFLLVRQGAGEQIDDLVALWTALQEDPDISVDVAQMRVTQEEGGNGTRRRRSRSGARRKRG